MDLGIFPAFSVSAAQRYDPLFAVGKYYVGLDQFVPDLCGRRRADRSRSVDVGQSDAGDHSIAVAVGRGCGAARFMGPFAQLNLHGTHVWLLGLRELSDSAGVSTKVLAISC